MRGRKSKPMHKQCRQCGEWFTLKPRAHSWQKFCTLSCAATHRMNQPKQRKRQSQLAKALADPETMRARSKLAWANPETRARLTAKIKARANSKEHLAWMAKHNKRLWSDPKFRKQHAERTSEAIRKTWENPYYRKKVSALVGELNKERWADPAFKERTSRNIRIAKANPLEKRRQSKASRERMNRPENLARSSEIMKARWADPEQAARMSKNSSESARKRWRDDPVYRRKQIAHLLKAARDPEKRASMSVQNKARWADPAYRERQKAIRSTPEYKAAAAERNRQRWADPAYKARVSKRISAARKGKLRGALPRSPG